MNADNWFTFEEFVKERHRIWERRQTGEPGPWTEDPILRSHKFTNVFRILDPGSQFLLTDLFDDFPDERTTLMRCFLYRHTGRIEAWQYLYGQFGSYPEPRHLNDVLDAWKEFRDRSKAPFFTNAYLVFPQSQVPGTDKIESIVDLTKRLFTPGSDQDIVPDFLKAHTQRERFAVLRRNKGVGDFMSMQILTDWSYSPGQYDRENDFIVPGPGAIKGAKYLSTDKAPEVLRWAWNAFLDDPDCPTIEMPTGYLRKPSLMDVQNCLCEFSKYMRKPAREQAYEASHSALQLRPEYPTHWM